MQKKLHQGKKPRFEPSSSKSKGMYIIYSVLTWLSKHYTVILDNSNEPEDSPPPKKARTRKVLTLDEDEEEMAHSLGPFPSSRKETQVGDEDDVNEDDPNGENDENYENRERFEHGKS